MRKRPLVLLALAFALSAAAQTSPATALYYAAEGTPPPPERVDWPDGALGLAARDAYLLRYWVRTLEDRLVRIGLYTMHAKRAPRPLPWWSRVKSAWTLAGIEKARSLRDLLWSEAFHMVPGETLLAQRLSPDPVLSVRGRFTSPEGELLVAWYRCDAARLLELALDLLDPDLMERYFFCRSEAG